MTINVIVPAEPKDPSSIYKYKSNEQYSGDLEGLLILCLLGLFLGIVFKVIEIPCIAALILLSIYLTAKNGEINITSCLPLILLIIMTSGMAWVQQRAYYNKHGMKQE